MKRFFQVIGMLALIGFTFFYTGKATTVVKEMDDIMIRIRKEGASYETAPMDAKVVNDTIVPGLYGKTIDESKSYEKMKRYGSFNQNLFVYKETKPHITLKNNLNRYIVQGNPNKKMVSLLFIVENEDQIDSILEILKSKDIKATFFLDGTWFENHNQEILQMVKDGHNLGNFSYQLDYTNSSFVWMNAMIKKIGKQHMNFCYNEELNEESLNICSLQKNYTIRPNIVVTSNPFMEVKKFLKAGSMVSFQMTETVKRELPVIIDYIKSKDYQLVTLEDHIKES